MKNIHSALRLPKSAREGTYPTTYQKKREYLEKLMRNKKLPPHDQVSQQFSIYALVGLAVLRAKPKP